MATPLTLSINSIEMDDSFFFKEKSPSTQLLQRGNIHNGQKLLSVRL